VIATAGLTVAGFAVLVLSPIPMARLRAVARAGHRDRLAWR
jgi:hypothetical protein